MSIPEEKRGTTEGSRNEAQVELPSTFPCPCCSTTLKLSRRICSQRKISLCGRAAQQAPKTLPAAGNVARATGSWPGLSWWSPRKSEKCPWAVGEHRGLLSILDANSPQLLLVGSRLSESELNIWLKGLMIKRSVQSSFLQKCAWCQCVMSGGGFAWNIQALSFQKTGYWWKAVGWEVKDRYD